jgi:hypothetical protein
LSAQANSRGPTPIVPSGPTEPGVRPLGSSDPGCQPSQKKVRGKACGFSVETWIFGKVWRDIRLLVQPTLFELTRQAGRAMLNARYEALSCIHRSGGDEGAPAARRRQAK